MNEQHELKPKDNMRLYSTHEVIKRTGILPSKLKYMDDTGKIVPVSRTVGMRYYSEEQLYKIMKMVKKPVEVAYVCVDHREKCGNYMSEVEELKNKREAMMERIASLENKEIFIVADVMIDDMENSNTEKLIHQAKEGLVSRLYVASDIGFPKDLVNEYIKWFKYLGVEVVDLAEMEV